MTSNWSLTNCTVREGVVTIDPDTMGSKIAVNITKFRSHDTMISSFSSSIDMFIGRPTVCHTGELFIDFHVFYELFNELIHNSYEFTVAFNENGMNFTDHRIDRNTINDAEKYYILYPNNVSNTFKESNNILTYTFDKSRHIIKLLINGICVFEIYTAAVANIRTIWCSFNPRKLIRQINLNVIDQMCIS